MILTVLSLVGVGFSTQRQPEKGALSVKIADAERQIQELLQSQHVTLSREQGSSTVHHVLHMMYRLSWSVRAPWAYHRVESHPSRQYIIAIAAEEIRHASICADPLS